MWSWIHPLSGCPAILLLCMCWAPVHVGGAVQSGGPTTLLPKPASPCIPVLEKLQGQNGYVVWTEQVNVSCDESRKWILSVPPDHGSVLHLQYIYVRTVTHFRLYSYRLENGLSQTKEIPVKRNKGETSLFRITIIRDGVMFTVETSKVKTQPLSTFNISYAVYPLSSLPSKIIVDTPSIIGTSSVMFNCSTGSPVPEAMACDGVKHCIGDEDEEPCEYRQYGCEDWVPYKDQCFKLDVVVRPSQIPGQTYITSPTGASKACREKYGATLATLPNEEVMNFVATMLYQSGFSSIAVDLHKVDPVSKKHEHLYRYVWQWGPKGSPIAYEQTALQKEGTMFACAVMELFPWIHFRPLMCFRSKVFPGGYACMKPNPRTNSDIKPKQVQLQKATRAVHQFLTKQCEDGSVVQIFHHCQWKDNVLSTAWSPNHFPLFYCQYGPPVHYSLVCDGLDDCTDGSDETKCPFPETVSKKDRVYVCENHQVIPQKKRCDGVPNCFDGSDEQSCTSCQQIQCLGVGCVPEGYVEYFDSCTRVAPYQKWQRDPLPGEVPFVSFDGFGMSAFRYRKTLFGSLEGYFQCSNGIYIPSFLINNGELDCHQGEDENIPPENFTCPGFYRCQYSGNCLHADFICDGISHCPNKDDERYCNLPHLSNCTCEGYACSCDALSGPLSDFWYLRYLDLTGVIKPSISELVTLDFLQFLNLSFCQLSNVTLVGMPQLKILDLSYNILLGLYSMVMENLLGLTHLNISGNPLVTQLDAAFSAFITRSGMTNIQHLVMTDTDICQIEDNSLSTLAHLVSLDIRKNKLEKYSKNALGGLHSLTLLQTDESRLCCSYFHNKMPECHAPIDELSSCSDLLRLDFFRVFLWTFSVMTILGNGGVLVYKVITRKRKRVTSYRILVSHLCVADFLMGIYMMIIGAADVHFRGNYVASERTWRKSGACLVAGFLAFTSSEMSAFIISLITLDRLLMLCFPFKFHLHLSAKSSMKLSCVAWALVLLLASVPLMAQLDFYGESSICLPLPITRHQFSGQTYSFLVFIVINFLLFIFIGIGQVAIYWAVQKAKTAVKSKRQEEDSSIAQRLFLVVFTDFCCWFPVGLMGLLAFSGVPVPGMVSVWVAVFVLPINSALNPFLYTLSSVREKWNIKKLNRKSKRIMCNLRGEFPKLAPDLVEDLMLMYVGTNRGVKLEKLSKVLNCGQEQGNNEGNSGYTHTLVEESACTSTTECKESTM